MKKFKILTIVFISFVLIFNLTGIINAGIDSLKISGFSDGDIEVTVAELKGLPVVEENVTSVNSSGKKSNYAIKGAYLSDLLKEYGKKQSDLKAIRFIAGDGYGIDVPGDIMEQQVIILAYQINGQPIEEKYKPVRAVIPEERSMYWVKNLIEIKVIDYVEPAEYKRLTFLETAVDNVETTDYTYYESVDKAVKTSGLMDYLQINNEVRTVNMVAADGFIKDEEKDIFENGYIKVTGEAAPMFLSPDIPKGMYVKELTFVGSGDDVIFSYDRGLDVFEETDIDGHKGIKISSLLSEAGLVKADKYSLIASDGYKIEVTYNDLEEGIVYKDEKGRIRSLFKNLSKKTSIKYLQIIKGEFIASERS